MKIRIHFYLFSSVILISCLFVACEKETPTDLTKSVLIPQPLSVTATGSSFLLKNDSKIVATTNDPELIGVGQILSGQLAVATGLSIKLHEGNEGQKKGDILLELTDSEPSFGGEGYQLEITNKQVKISSNTPSGIFWGTQTLLQLLPAQAGDTGQIGSFVIPTGSIQDYPVYSHRGSMLDVSRHFFDVDDVKRYIDFLAAFKMNVLHLHLSDDQGWRIEIKKWPNLATHGGSTQVGGGKGGFYTQEQYKDLVQYAADRFITIIPEIDMPGHTNAALASYPELNCNGKATELYTGTEVGFSSLCTSNEITYQFIDDVIAELSAITPGPYIHIGGDESHATKKEDYLAFVNRVKGIVEKHGKKMIGWDETAQADLTENSTVQLWASPAFAKEAVSKGAKIIMSPATRTYLDMQYDSTTRLGLHWAAYIEVDSSYLWAPETFIKGISKEDIIGIEAPLWTETITTMDEIEYMVFPRLLSIAEIGWTPANNRNWENFKGRLAAFGKRMEAMGIDFYRSELVPWEK